MAGGYNSQAGEVTAILTILLLVFLVIKNRNSIAKLNPAYFLLVSWTTFGLIGFGLYKQHIYDHYYGFIFMVPSLFLGIVISVLFKYKMIGKIIGTTLLAYLVFVNLNNNPFKLQPNNQLRRAYDVARRIETESAGQRFNLGVIAEQNYEDGYKYFLLKDNSPVVSIDSQVSGSITDQLFAVCELYPTSKCDPTHNASAAIANFGWSKVETQWEVDGVIIYKLVHSQKP